MCQISVIYAFLHSLKTQSPTCLYVLGVEVQGVADFGDVYWSVVGHSFLLFCYLHDLLDWFLLVIGPDLKQTGDTDRSVTATKIRPLQNKHVL